MLRWLLVPAAVFCLVAPANADPLRPELDGPRVLRMLDDFPAPSAWSGIWNYQVSIYICGSDTPLFTESMTDTVCTGEPLEFDEDQTCSGSYTSSSVQINCQWQEDIIEGCTASYTLALTGTVSGSSMQQTGTINVTYSGAGCGEEFEDMCTRTVITGTRVAPQPASCSTPVDPATWGAIKAQYR